MAKDDALILPESKSAAAQKDGVCPAARGVLVPVLLAIAGVTLICFQLITEQWVVTHGLNLSEETLALVPNIHRLAPFLYRSTPETPEHTVIVLIQETSACAIRQRMTEILAATKKAQAIVFDFTLGKKVGEEDCPADTQLLVAQIQEACTSRFPVVFGFELDPDTGAHVPHLDPRPSGESKCALGATNGKKRDTRIIPLDFNSGSDLTLAWAAATQVRPGLASELQPYLNGGPPLYAQPLDRLDYTRFRLDDTAFLAAQGNPELWSNTVLVVGSQDEKDIQISGSTRPVKGSEMQARYLEALLSRGYLLPLPWRIDMFVLISTAVWLWMLARRELRNGVALLFLGAIGVLILDAAVISRLNYFFEFTSVSVLTICLWPFEKFKEIQCVRKFFPAREYDPALPWWRRFIS